MDTPAWLDKMIDDLRDHIVMEGPLAIHVWAEPEGPTRHIEFYPAIILDEEGDPGWDDIQFDLAGVQKVVEVPPTKATTEEGVMFEFQRDETPYVLHLMVWPPDDAEPMYVVKNGQVLTIEEAEGKKKPGADLPN